MNKLTEALQTLADLHEALVETAKKKQQILISAELNPLLSILAEESKLIKKIQVADQKRTAILGEQANQHSLAELIEREPDDAVKKEWSDLYTHLKSLLAEIEQVNLTNQQLIKQSLTFTNYMIEQMVPSSNGTGVYSPMAGTQEKQESVRFFDAKA
ncbi:flagellar protein FlgN [Neobacillus novalis]|uniref:Flagellar protein FlgN n=1 Tax=Neobacillus novalis TaxID=220687 RepID=A0AA95MVD7_9BACI|nr:flagellar protein FlgN [Neobacillus novalis]WHY88388.1 flagellar protein FlgN [Neobacillus novalis]